VKLKTRMIEGREVKEEDCLRQWS